MYTPCAVLTFFHCILFKGNKTFDPKDLMIPKFKVNSDSLHSKIDAAERQRRRKSFGEED